MKFDSYKSYLFNLENPQSAFRERVLLREGEACIRVKMET